MIIKFNVDRRDGACEYMKSGTNNDRNEKDIRIQLTDLSCEESINVVNEYLKKVNKYDKYKDNYKHIVLSFNEDELDEQTMKDIVQDFVKMYMHAYDESEYTYYAEAHVPKIKYNKNSEKRRTHIHIFIHKYSLELDRRLRFLTHPQRKKEINLIKHYLIKKYNLNYTFRHKAISKSNIDFYTSDSIKSSKELKQNIEQFIEQNLHNFTTFDDMLQQIQKTFDVKIRTSKNAKTPYISIKHQYLKRNIRLKGLLFSKETFMQARESLLKNIKIKKYDEEYFLTLDEILEQLKERQQLLKNEVKERFTKVREYVAKRKQAAQMQVTLKELNKIMFKLQILNTALNINLQVLKEFKDVAVFNNENSLRLISKNKNVNIDINTREDNFNAIASGKDTEAEAKILANILADKIKRHEIKKEDVIIAGSVEFKLYVNKFLNEALNNIDKKEIGREGKERNDEQHTTRTLDDRQKKKIKTIDF